MKISARSRGQYIASQIPLVCSYQVYVSAGWVRVRLRRGVGGCGLRVGVRVGVWGPEVELGLRLQQGLQLEFLEYLKPQLKKES